MKICASWLEKYKKEEYLSWQCFPPGNTSNCRGFLLAMRGLQTAEQIAGNLAGMTLFPGAFSLGKRVLPLIAEVSSWQ